MWRRKAELYKQKETLPVQRVIVFGNGQPAEKYYQAKEKGYELISYVSPHAVTWPGLVIGDNCFIGDYSVISPFVEIGNNIQICSGSNVGHHCVIKDHCFISPGAVILGSATIEP